MHVYIIYIMLINASPAAKPASKNGVFMNVGIIGAGKLGTALAKRLGQSSYQVMLSYSRDEARLRDAAQQFGALAGSPREAVAFGEAVALTVPWAPSKAPSKRRGHSMARFCGTARMR